MTVIDVGVRLSLQNRAQYVQGIEQASKSTDRLGAAAENAGRRASIGARGLDGMRTAAGHAGRGLGALAGGLGALAGGGLRIAGRGVGLLAAGLGGLAAAATVTGLKAYSSMQQATVAFTTMLGSGQKARAFLGELKTFAAATPFELPGLVTASQSLISAGFAARDVVPILTSVGNATSGMGTGAEGVQRATIALQQMSAAGKITGEDLNQLRDAGIPVFDLLSAATGKTKGAIAQLAQQGKLGRVEMNQLFDALKTGKGLEKFNGLMDKQSRTLAGRISTVKDTVRNGLAGLLSPVGDVLGKELGRLQPRLDRIGKRMSTVGEAGRGGHPGASSGGRIADVAVVAGLGESGALKVERAYNRLRVEVPKAIATVRRAIVQAGPAVHRVLDGIGPAARDAFGSLQEQAPTIRSGLHAVGEVLGFVGRHMGTIVKYGLPLLIAALAAMRVKQAAANVTLAVSLPLRIIEAVLLHRSASANRALATQMKAQIAMSRAQTASTVATTGAQRGLNAALKANMIGIIIVAVTLLVAGIILLWKHSERFRTVVKVVFREVAQAALWMADKWLMAYQLIARAAGKLPGPLGAPFRAADKAIGKVRDKLKGLSSSLEELGRTKTTIPVQVEIRTAQTDARAGASKRGLSQGRANQLAVSAGRAAGASIDGHRANGGRTLRSRVYVVGEREPELFVPDMDGRVVTQQQAAAQAAGPRLTPLSYATGGSSAVAGGDGGAALALGRGGDTHNWHITVNEARDGKDAYEEVSRRVEDVLARR
jgi:tape measure domain-containing protein